jgi:hypothetical protein
VTKPKPNSRLWGEDEDAIIREIAGEKGNISPVYIGMMKSKLPKRTHDSIRVRAKMLIKGTAHPPKVTAKWPSIPKNGDELHVQAIIKLKMRMLDEMRRELKEELNAQ